MVKTALPDAAKAQAATAASPPIPFQADARSDGPAGGQWLVALLVCGAAFVALLAVLRRFGMWHRSAAPEQGAIAVTRRAHLAHTTQLVTVEYRGRRLLLAVAPTHTTCLRDDALDAGVPSQCGGAK